MKKMLELIGVKKVYKTKSGDTAALNEVSISFPKTGLVFITGKSGSGKTTMLNVIGGLDGIDQGQIILDGKDFSTFTDKDYNSYRNTFIGFIFQEYNLLSEYTVQKNLELATELQGIKVSKERIDEILKIVDLEGLNDRKPNQLSGGQKQRVAIARALIKNPKIIMADEPTGALDSQTGIAVLDSLKKLSKDKLVIIVSHDLELAEKYADRVVRLIDGKIVEDVIVTEEEISSNISETENGIFVKLGSDLNKTETETLLKNIREKRKVKFIDKIGVRKKSATKPLEDNKNVEPPKFINSKMKTKSCMGLGMSALKVKPLRLIFTVLLSVIAFGLFGLFDTIAAYDNARAISNILKTSEYNSIVVNAEQTENGSSYSVRVDKDTIESLNSNTNYDFRGLYEIDDKYTAGVSTKTQIEELRGDDNLSVVGSGYYSSYVDDFIEFSKSEIKGRVIDKNGFNYTIIKGRYPNLPSALEDESGNKITGINSFKEVAISKFMAESFEFYLRANSTGTPKLNGKEINSINDLIDAEFSIDVHYNGKNITYKIVGIIDCGEIPEKYDILKTKGTSNNQSTLKTSLDTFINSGAHLKLFVPTGYVKEWREFNGRTNTYFMGNNNYTISSGDTNVKDLTISYYGRTAFYKAEDNYNQNKIIFFKNDVTKVGENDVVIPFTHFEDIYKSEIRSFADNYINEKVSLTKSTVENTKISFDEKIKAVRSLFNYGKPDTNEGTLSIFDKTISLNKTNTIEEISSSYAFNIVGVYIDVNNDYWATSLYTFRPLMFSENGLSKIGVYTAQAEYSRAISPINKGAIATKKLASYVTNESGLTFNWYKNNVLGSIGQNRQSLKDFSNLFLYVSIVLAVFSVFMLFNYISSSIVSKRQSIGVLRALGSNSKNILTMFITESLFISFVNAVFACLTAFVGCIFVNMYIKNIMNLTLSFALFGFRQILIITLISMITGIISSIIPIIKICKEKPIELIRKD